MTDRDREIWGMVWRYGLVVVLTLAAVRIVVLVFAGSLFLQMLAVTGVILFPMWLAERARRANQADNP